MQGQQLAACSRRAAVIFWWVWLPLLSGFSSIAAFQRCGEKIKQEGPTVQKAALFVARDCTLSISKPTKWNRCQVLNMATPSREDEIKRKILQLRKLGKLKPQEQFENDTLTSYQEKVKNKLGSRKSNHLAAQGDTDVLSGILTEIESLDDEPTDDTSNETTSLEEQPRGRVGALNEEQVDAGASFHDQFSRASISSVSLNSSIFKEPEVDGPDLSDDDLVELVAARLAEQQDQKTQLLGKSTQGESSEETPEMTTSGIGGNWLKDECNSTDLYKPKSGSWGAFPRPKDISKAYGGGRRVGAGFSKEDDAVASINTQNRLKEYRRKVGIDVPDEKEHAAEIEEALQIAQLAMQRGVYATAVSSLEKVTKWCSTNSKVGSKIFLELAMAYEATGRTQEAYQVYKTLTTCRMEDVKFNAKRLLYGLEAMEMMRELSSDFSRQKIKNTFMDATGLRDIARNFDDVYQTAYVDLESGFYKRLTESVVRSNGEARQILFKATGKGEVGRMKVVQALRSLARHFDDALEIEIESEKKREPTAFLNGKPILTDVQATQTDKSLSNVDGFVLASPQEMLDNLEGSWRLQLLADKQGDGVSFFNTTTAIQEFSTAKMIFAATGPSGLTKIKCYGKLQMDSSKRVLDRSDVRMEGATGSILGLFGSNKNSGFLAAVSRQQQIVIVDSMLLVTKSPPGSRKGRDSEKEHFAVWRRVSGSDAGSHYTDI